MRRLIIRFYYFFKSKSYMKYLITTLLLALLFVGFGLILYFFFDSNVNETVIGSAFGFAASNIVFYLIGIFSRLFEDRIKVNTDTKDLFKIYKDPNYRKVVKLNDTECVVCYNDVLINDNYTFHVDDNPDKNFDLDGFIEENYVTLFETHASSSKENVKTIRLDDVEKKNDKEYIFHLSRSNYYNHLVTNRALDFQISRDLSVRTYYEYGPYIHPLKESQLSNHIGINALVFLDDGHILFPQRKRDSTISKNGMTAAIATRLLFPHGKKEIDEKYLFSDCIYDCLEDRLSIDLNKINKDDVEIHFLGVGQNIYEGGKPQMYYFVKLHNINLGNYQSILLESKQNQSKIDNDKKIHIAKFDSLKFVKNTTIVRLESYDYKKNKYKVVKLEPERSLLCNIWHYQRYLEK